ncbi:hypothetical protein SETIT_7G243400v2 [Setaria italica]|uniref:Uncharacterized protein n=1 Tax=Setaria italica TaxID=4555 RepID=A0A368RZ42_SETIT|nr:hypothetical protein SETIT_7G243400v2 [Setaria italica]
MSSGYVSHCSYCSDFFWRVWIITSCKLTLTVLFTLNFFLLKTYELLTIVVTTRLCSRYSSFTRYILFILLAYTTGPSRDKEGVQIYIMEDYCSVGVIYDLVHLL